MENGFSAIRLDHGCSVKALAISYPNNADTSAPKEYPPAILMMGISPSVENIVFDCAWIGCEGPAGANVGQGLYRDITGFVHRCGIRIDRGADVNRFEDIHWFVGGSTPPGRSPYYLSHRVGFEFNSVDGVVMSGCFIIGGKTFLHQGTGGGHSLGYQVSRCWIEDVDEGFVFEGACGFVIDNSNILVRDKGTGVRIATDGLFYNAAVTSTQIRGFGKPFVGIEYEVRKAHERNRLSVADCSIVDCDPAIRLGPGAMRASIHDNHQRPLKGRPAITIDPAAALFTITNNIITADVPGIADHSGDVPKTISGNLFEPRTRSQAFPDQEKPSQQSQNNSAKKR
jgi:hypothetical protein